MTEWYHPPEKIEEFHNSKARVRFLLGGRGSSKTTSASMESIRHGFHVAGGRVIVLRKTKESNVSTAVQTFNTVYDLQGFEDNGDDTSLFKKWGGGESARIPSAEAIRLFNDFMKRGPRKSEIQAWIKSIGARYCTMIEFKGLKDEKISESVLRSLECTMLVLIEADQLTEVDFKMAQQCLRKKDAFGNHVADKNCIVETNPPGPSHWIAQLEKKHKEGEYQDYGFWHLKTADNAHNLDPGDSTTIPPRLSYLESLKRDYAGNPPMYARMVEGEYSEAHSGNPVFYKFSLSLHKAKELPWPTGAYLIRTWDFGVFNAVCWSAYWSQVIRSVTYEYLWFMAESYLEGSDIDAQTEEALKVTEEQFPFWNDRDICSGLKDYADPTGAARTGHGKNRSYFKVLHSHGIYPGFRYLDIAPSVVIVNRALSAVDPTGQPMIQVDEESCPLITAAFSGKYRYPAKGEAGYGADNAAPVKGEDCDNIDHIADVARYTCHNILKLIQIPETKAKPPIGKLAFKSNTGSINKSDMYGKRPKPSIFSMR